MPADKAQIEEIEMYAHRYFTDAYYAEQAASHEVAYGWLVYQPNTEVKIPMCWIMTWLGAVSGAGLGLGLLIHFVA